MHNLRHAFMIMEMTMKIKLLSALLAAVALTACSNKPAEEAQEAAINAHEEAALADAAADTTQDPALAAATDTAMDHADAAQMHADAAHVHEALGNDAAAEQHSEGAQMHADAAEAVSPDAVVVPDAPAAH